MGGLQGGLTAKAAALGQGAKCPIGLSVHSRPLRGFWPKALGLSTLPGSASPPVEVAEAVPWFPGLCAPQTSTAFAQTSLRLASGWPPACVTPSRCLEPGALQGSQGHREPGVTRALGTRGKLGLVMPPEKCGAIDDFVLCWYFKSSFPGNLCHFLKISQHSPHTYPCLKGPIGPSQSPILKGLGWRESV